MTQMVTVYARDVRMTPSLQWSLARRVSADVSANACKRHSLIRPVVLEIRDASRDVITFVVTDRHALVVVCESEIRSSFRQEWSDID